MEKDSYENLSIDSIQRIDCSLDVSADYLRGIERWLLIIAICVVVNLLIIISNYLKTL